MQAATATGLTAVVAAEIEPVRRLWRGHSFDQPLTGEVVGNSAFDSGLGLIRTGDVIRVRSAEGDELFWVGGVNSDGTVVLGEPWLGSGQVGAKFDVRDLEGQDLDISHIGNPTERGRVRGAIERRMDQYERDMITLTYERLPRHISYREFNRAIDDIMGGVL